MNTGPFFVQNFSMSSPSGRRLLSNSARLLRKLSARFGFASASQHVALGFARRLVSFSARLLRFSARCGL